MPNRIAESFLALFAGRPRAAVIYGDLTEMAATRGRGWFAAAYLRTLVSLTWRIVLALFVAVVSRELIFDAFHVYTSLTPRTWRTTDAPYLLNSAGPLLACIMTTLWFVLPFAAVRYGLRDRLVRLTFVVALGTTVAFLFIPTASLLFAATTVAVGAAALFSRTWRRPAIALAAIGATGLIALATELSFIRLVLRDFHIRHAPPVVYGALMPTVFQATLLLIALVCSRAHHWLADGQASPNSKIA
jgi:hypothetical protein